MAARIEVQVCLPAADDRKAIQRFSLPDGRTYNQVLAEATQRYPSIPAWTIVAHRSTVEETAAMILSSKSTAAQLAMKVGCHACHARHARA
jgi:hypothetical protein